jgi:hypothetical protein
MCCLSICSACPWTLNRAKRSAQAAACAQQPAHSKVDAQPWYREHCRRIGRLLDSPAASFVFIQKCSTRAGQTPKFARSHKLSSSKPIALHVPRALAVWPSKPSRMQAKKIHFTQPSKSPSAEYLTAVNPHTNAPIVNTDGAAHFSASTILIPACRVDWTASLTFFSKCHFDGLFFFNFFSFPTRRCLERR